MKVVLYAAAMCLVFTAVTAQSGGFYKVGATPPVLQRFVAPSYPNQAAASHLGGSVNLWVVVAEDGSVSEAKVRSPGAGKELDESAVRAVRKWSFAPAVRNGKAVPVIIEFPVSYDPDSLEIRIDLEHLSN